MRSFRFFISAFLFSVLLLSAPLLPVTALAAHCVAPQEDVIPGSEGGDCYTPSDSGTPVDTGGRQSGLVVCGNLSGDQCTFTDLINQIQTVINFLIFKIASPLAAVMFAYAGFLYVTNRGNESQIKQAHDIFWNVFIGLVIALAAWLTMSFILKFFLGGTSSFNLLG